MAGLDLVELRHRLHQNAETAFQEKTTAGIVREKLHHIGMDIVAEDVAGHGILARTGADTGGKRILLRSDLDALPLEEATGVDYASTGGTHHACGHDGHMTMLIGALERIAQAPPCEVWALFQPAEETGEGMAKALEHAAIPDHFDAVVAFHNQPGHPLGQVLLRDGIAAVASTGMVLRFTGQTSHAAEPRLGRNPIPAAARLVKVIEDLPAQGDDHAVSALVQIEGGGPKFGTSAGDCLVATTIRAGTDDALKRMIDHLTRAARKEAEEEGLELDVEEVEPFPATMNDADVVKAIGRAAEQTGLEVHDPGAFPWSEDFGHATARWPGALVGLGAGEDHPSVHRPDYDFPDALIDKGVALWVAIVEELA